MAARNPRRGTKPKPKPKTKTRSKPKARRKARPSAPPPAPPPPPDRLLEELLRPFLAKVDAVLGEIRARLPRGAAAGTGSRRALGLLSRMLAEPAAELKAHVAAAIKLIVRGSAARGRPGARRKLYRQADRSLEKALVVAGELFRRTALLARQPDDPAGEHPPAVVPLAAARDMLRRRMEKLEAKA